RVIAGIRLPTTATGDAAVALARTASPEFLFNHALRTYVFAALLAGADGQQFDEEAIFIACCLHDLGLVARFRTPDRPFELDGAFAAKDFLAERGFDAKRSELVVEAIAFHTSPLAELRPPEVSMVGEGAGADVFGSGLKKLKPGQVDDVVAALPRLGFKTQFEAALVDYCTAKPRAAIGTWTDAFCRSHNHDFAFPTIEARLAAAPFKE
ncbi:MAG TPA: HD domain-containing protein, partial [Stellaceae bacterium]|nr:HD domain-containing protein [Stellaceae bacterium]